MKFEKLQPGMTVYDVGRHKMGNTTLTTVSVWSVRIISVDAEKRSVVASWNSNAPRTFYENATSKWKAQKPVVVRSGMGARLATREELKAMKAEAAPKSEA